MTYNRLFILVESYDDLTFVDRIIRPILEKKEGETNDK